MRVAISGGRLGSLGRLGRFCRRGWEESPARNGDRGVAVLLLLLLAAAVFCVGGEIGTAGAFEPEDECEALKVL